MKVQVFSKRALTIIGLVALLVIAGIINIALSKNSTKSDQETNDIAAQSEKSSEEVIAVVSSSAKTIMQYEAQRKIDRQKELQYLNEIITDENTDSKTMSTANNEKLILISAMDNENIITEILSSKGFKNIAVVCGNESVNVMINKKDVSDAKIAQILDVVLRETTVKSDRIKIIPVD